jgi:hypothetical protein
MLEALATAVTASTLKKRSWLCSIRKGGRDRATMIQNSVVRAMGHASFFSRFRSTMP